MKKIGTIFSLLSLSLLAVSCGLDNYDEPESFLEGKITYEGKQLGLKGTNGGIQLQLYQDGYANQDIDNQRCDRNQCTNGREPQCGR